MALFVLCLVTIGGAIGFVGGVLVVGGSAYSEGWQACERRHAMGESERRNAGFRVVER